ncbi:probable ASI3 Putative integral membrane E3 ubiquitin ligase, role in negative regulation of amino acid uptake [Rhynchosporium agropyri]|uniref:Probable ASI3 Putative integral membrane E3 ubiquitin ligase, role in negative regulation of amino acid uptake n=1 Tax=Rhynchosporium agropyri TaxID=914238 RepID=A0A1E1L8D6_9HELO|nr:probable ASI3 Putative integral membrane E3 ubiquitin ligase, role in negative regulation of amino acid uptake [Rhynchosporium agropyri]
MAAATFDQPLPKFDLGGAWNWTFNATQYVPSAKDLALAGPRMFMKLGSILSVPEAVDNMFGGVRLGQRIIPEATGNVGVANAVTTAAAGGFGTENTINASTQILVDIEEQAGGLTNRFTMEGARSLGNVFSYATSKWALGCIVVAVVLNRTSVYASTRRNLVLGWKIRLFVRILPIVLLLTQSRSILQSIQCQTSPDFAMMRWGNASRTSELMFTQNGGYLHELSSALLLGASDQASCVAVGMVEPEYDDEIVKDHNGEMPKTELTGSLSLIWPLFKTLCFSHFIETLSCAVVGRRVAGETGMTIFEHSLAFAEADAAIGNQLGFGPFGTINGNSSSTAEATKIAITRSMIMKKVNTTPEVLLVGFLSAMNHLTSHILAIFNLQSRCRLANTAFWGLSFMSAIVWSIWSFSIDDLPNQSLLRFPTVCIIGFVPHFLVLLGIIGCSIIYATALVLSALAPPAIEDAAFEEAQSRIPFFRRVLAAHRNMQANVPLSSIKIALYMDFYSALLKTGFSVMTMASEAVYLNESRGVSIKQRTWLEEDRLRELEAVGAQWLGPTFKLNDPDASLADGLINSVGLVAAKDQPMDLLQKSSSGYTREMTAKKVASGNGRDRGAGVNGVGAAERSGRWIMALEFFIGISRLLLSWWASLALRLLSHAGFHSRPRWLTWLVRMPKAAQTAGLVPDKNDPDSLNFWLLSIDGELTLPKDEHVDVEAEMRSRLRQTPGQWYDSEEEQKLDSNLYNWWLHGGWWGVDDNSGSFNPEQAELDEDTTSVVSFATTPDEYAWESDDEDGDGRRTPTKDNPFFAREPSPFTDTPLTSSDLAQLLHPKTPEQRAEAQALSAHLGSDTIVTRSRYRNIMQRERAQVLTSTLHRPSNFTASSATGKLTLEEEAQILEHLIISRRSFNVSTSTSSSGQPKSWAKGASGMGDGGPQCVVCQSSPRSIIVWPCRCLSLCDDCRVTLAMNNFDKCVCCRRDVASFSRVFIP